MAEIKRSQLFGRLNSVAYKSIEGATVFCKMRGNPYVELIHWINQLCQTDNSDFSVALKESSVDTAILAKDMTNALNALPRGASSISDFSSHVELAAKEAWLVASLMFGQSSVRTGHLLISILRNRDLSLVFLDISREFSKLKADTLADNFDKLFANTAEAGLAATEAGLGGGTAPGQAAGSMAPAQMGKQEALKQFTVDLTAQALSGKMDPIEGRDEEIRNIIDILMRRRQNNPILTGEAGVGKTAVVEGFAQRIAKGDVPPPLRGVSLLSLDIGLLQAGASMKGEFENRLKQVIEEVQTSEKPIILFIDEAHTLIGAGGAAGQNDAANLLKPALARGTLRTIAATTWMEYKKFFEKDPALSRRFQNINVGEPDDAKAFRMIRGVAGKLTEHHKVEILDEAIRAAVTFSRRYIPSRHLPDKAVSVLDTACARVAVTQYSEPAEHEDCRRKIDAIKVEIEILQKEESVGVEHDKRLAELATSLTEQESRLADLDSRWKSEKEVVQRIVEARAKLRKEGKEVPPLEKPADSKDAAPEKSKDEALAQLKLDQAELAKLQDDKPLVLPSVDERAVGIIIEEWTGIPVKRMVKDELSSVITLEKTLTKRVVGQDHAMESIAKRIRTARASLADPNKPIAVFMLAGPSGVGKTETALALAETLYGGEQNLITINMSEYQEAHTVSLLKGAPPGYVGYGQGGVLTEAVRRRPYSVVLLDEVEKAHKDVHEIFFQVFDKGQMEDSEGTQINFRNTVIILTTNVGSDEVMSMCQDPDLMPAPDALGEGIRASLLKAFPAALLGRIVVIPYLPLSKDVTKSIIKLKLEKIRRRVLESYNAEFSYSDELLDLIFKRCTQLESGARMVDAVITNTILPSISMEFLKRVMSGGTLKSAKIGVKDDDISYELE